MYLSIWRQYTADCARFGWTPSIDGAVKYQRLTRDGYRQMWAERREQRWKK